MLRLLLWSAALVTLTLLFAFFLSPFSRIMLLGRLMDFMVRKVRTVLDLVAFTIGALFCPSRQRYLPPITNQLLLEPATKLAARIRAGKLKSEDLVQAYVDRCRAINPLLNAIVDENYERALEEARAVDERVARELRREKRPEELSVAEYPFLGVPFTTKNSIAVAGLTYSGGITARRGVTAERDAVAIDRMKKLGGAIFLGVTNVPEAVMWLDGFNLVDGQTNNPYDQSRIPGGSSAGEGAIIAGAGSVIGVGSDIGGSIRIPAHFCGIFGHKTTPTAVDPTGVWPPFASKRIQLLSLGPMTRFAVDLRPMLKVLVGEQRLELPERPLNFSTLNVYYMLKIDDPFVTPVDVEIEQGLDTVIRFFIEHGSRTIPLDTAHKFHDLRYALFLWCTAMNDPNNPSYLNLLTEGRRAAINPYWELLKCMVGRNKEYTAAILTLGISEELGFTSGEVKKDVYEAMLERLKKDLHELLSTDGVLICPTFPEIAFKHNQSMLKFSDSIYTSLWNAMNVAITTVPLGRLDRHGMPLSVQVIVSPNNDNLSIQVAEELERRFGGWVPPCPVQFSN